MLDLFKNVLRCSMSYRFFFVFSFLLTNGILRMLSHFIILSRFIRVSPLFDFFFIILFFELFNKGSKTFEIFWYCSFMPFTLIISSSLITINAYSGAWVLRLFLLGYFLLYYFSQNLLNKFIKLLWSVRSFPELSCFFFFCHQKVLLPKPKLFLCKTVLKLFINLLWKFNILWKFLFFPFLIKRKFYFFIILSSPV